ncbi:MAG: 6,7-dimethyl-8-ribityllumazine synthase [Planctomycetota bacterium]|jgi:6,7-dimethyl-8-ribityllumazine synthase
MPNFLQGELDGSDLSVAVVVSRFNEEICERLLDGCLEELTRLGVPPGDIDVYRVPGAFEIPPVVSRCLDEDRYDSIVTLGCVIRGETSHYDHICETTAHQLSELAQNDAIPVIFGVLTTETRDQAEARSGGGKSHHGVYAARAAVEMARLFEEFSDSDEDEG